jgi:RimJ/RimL family protein N-acetyltransferase
VVDPDNIASRRVAIRNGFQEIGVRNGRVLHIKDADLPPNKALRPTRVDACG